MHQQILPQVMNMQKYDLVKVGRLNSAEWHDGAILSLQVKSGEVIEVSETKSDKRNILVRFDNRPAAWHSHQIPSHSWWFSRDELEYQERVRDWSARIVSENSDA